MGSDPKISRCGREQIVADLWGARIVAWSIRAVRNFHLIDWTMQEARQLSPEHRTHSEVDGSFDRLLEAFRERLEPSTNDTISQIANAPSIQLPYESPTEQSFSEAVALTSNFPAATPDAAPATGWVDAEMSNLLKAIVEPDIYTARADRNRAIDLRWVLRDIRSNRLNWSPVNPHDLRMLTIMGLVEMRDDAPVLTNAGVSVIE
jgi:hypothetical protein